MIAQGYSPENILMVGDAPVDMTAAKKMGIHFYPIMADWEEESWEAFTDEALPRFVLRQYDAYEEERTQIFVENLGG
jgi:histidinol phosphatase-like enzyme